MRCRRIHCLCGESLFAFQEKSLFAFQESDYELKSGFTYGTFNLWIPLRNLWVASRKNILFARLTP